MKLTNGLACLVALVLVTLLSCNKKEDPAKLAKPQPPITFSDILICHRTSVWDSAAIHNKLIGKYKWEYINCFWKPDDANNMDYKDVQVEFLLDNTLQLKEKGELMQTATWQVTDLQDGFFKINMTPLVPLLNGRILFCDSLALFYDSYVDGCDNYFKRTN